MVGDIISKYKQYVAAKGRTLLPDNMEDIQRVATKMVEAFEQGTCGVMLQGVKGTGKSALLWATFAAYLSERNRSNLRGDSPWNGEYLHITDEDLRDRLYGGEEIDPDVLFLDDWGSIAIEKDYGNTVLRSERFLKERYERRPRRITMITTNLNKQAREKYAKERLDSRIDETFLILTLTKDMR